MLDKQYGFGKGVDDGIGLIKNIYQGEIAGCSWRVL